MEQYLMCCLHSYILQNNPDLNLALQTGSTFSLYLEEKVAMLGPGIDRLIDQDATPDFITEYCLKQLTQDLRPSRFLFLMDILKTFHPHYYSRLAASGMLTMEATNIIAFCFDLFETFGFDRNSGKDEGFVFALNKAIDDYKRFSVSPQLN